MNTTNNISGGSSIQPPPLIEHFERAYQLAIADQSVPHNLPLLWREEGSLLNQKYRFKITYQCDSDSTTKSSTLAKSDDGSSLTATVVDAKEIAVRDAWKDIPLEHAPTLTPGISILADIYPGGNVKKLDKMGKVCATVTMGGNDFVIGTYATQYQAEAVVQAALQYDDGDDGGTNVPKFDGVSEDTTAKILEIESITLETIVASFHKDTSSKGTKRKFSIHDWALQQMKYKEYLRKVIDAKNIANRKRTSIDCNRGQIVVDTENPYRQRKRRVPRRVQHNKYEIP